MLDQKFPQRPEELEQVNRVSSERESPDTLHVLELLSLPTSAHRDHIFLRHCSEKFGPGSGRRKLGSFLISTPFSFRQLFTALELRRRSASKL